MTQSTKEISKLWIIPFGVKHDSINYGNKYAKQDSDTMLKN